MDFLVSLTGGGAAVGRLGLGEALFGLLLAFILGQLAAWAYIFTHAGLSYSRAFVQSIILLTFIISLGPIPEGSGSSVLEESLEDGM